MWKGLLGGKKRLTEMMGESTRRMELYSIR